MLACARLGAIHSVVFGGFARARARGAHRRRAGRRRSSPPPAGIEPGRVVAYKPLVDAAIGMARAQARLRRRAAARAGAGRARAGPRPRLARGAGRASAPAPCVPVGGMDPLYILYTSGHHRAAEGRGAARTPATWWRSPGRCRTSTRSTPATCSGRASDVGWVVGHSYICYGPLIVGATTVVFEGKPVGTPDAGAFWRVIAEHGVQELLHRADRLPRDQARGPGGQAGRRLRPRRAALSLPRRRAGRPGHDRVGAAAPGRAGDRPLVADRDRLGDRGEPGRASSSCRSSPARRRCRCRATTCGSCRRPASRCRRASSARSRSGCRCRRARCRRSGTPTSAS